MTEVARESMTSDTSQTSSLAWQQEDARSLQCNFFPVNLVFEVIFFKFSANPALLNQNPTFKQKSFHPPPQDILPGRVTGSENPEKLETLHCSQQPITVPLVPHQGQKIPGFTVPPQHFLPLVCQLALGWCLGR